jgi:hypothetical protein
MIQGIRRIKLEVSSDAIVQLQADTTQSLDLGYKQDSSVEMDRA